MCSMVEGDTTTIEVTKETWKRLNSEKMQPGESFDDAINHLLEQVEGCENGE
jgi:predicted CopG family antitoxin